MISPVSPTLDTEVIRKFYGLGEISIIPIKPRRSYFYRINSSENSFFLKLIETKRLLTNNAENSIGLSGCLQNGEEFRINKPIPTVDGQLSCNLLLDDSMYTGIMYPYLIGDYPRLDEVSALKFGRLIGAFHVKNRSLLATKYSEPRLNPYRTIADISQKTYEILDSNEVTRSITLFQMLNQAIREFSDFDRLDKNNNICHGDAWIGNIIASGDIWNLIDFDDICYCHPTLDTATFLWSIFVSIQDRTSVMKLWNAFRSGYLHLGPEHGINDSCLIAHFLLRDARMALFLLQEGVLPTSQHPVVLRNLVERAELIANGCLDEFVKLP